MQLVRAPDEPRLLCLPLARVRQPVTPAASEAIGRRVYHEDDNRERLLAPLAGIQWIARGWPGASDRTAYCPRPTAA
jgi:hypothetical protein